MIALLLASSWLAPSLAACASFLATWAFGGDLKLAVIAGATLGAAMLAFRLLGAKAALGLLAMGGLLLADRNGARRAEANRKLKEKADADRAVARAQMARDDADRRDADPGRLRDDDGFRRD